MMLAGTYTHQMDEKGRIRIPAKLRDELGKDKRLFITCGPHNCLLVLTEEMAEEALKSMSNDKFSTSDFSSIRRRIMTSGFIIEDDAQGRTLLTQKLINHAQLKKNIVTVGNLNRVEIWSQENWDRLQAEYDNQDFDEELNKAENYL